MLASLKTMALAVVGSALLGGILLPASATVASAATVASMQEAYEASEAARDTMMARQGHDRALPQGSALVGAAADGGTFRACRGTHLDHLKGRC